jgi:hypothetical protein
MEVCRRCHTDAKAAIIATTVPSTLNQKANDHRAVFRPECGQLKGSQRQMMQINGTKL